MHIDFFTRHAPAEIVLLILQFCDSTTDVLALVSSCRTLYNVWLNDSIATAALWTVWLRRIPHFRLAILAARMTQLVVDAERRGDLPPTGISPLQYQNAPPTLTELRAAIGIHRLSIALQGAFQRRILHYPMRIKPWPCRDMAGEVTPEEPDRMDRWTARVSQAIFRALIIGAALAGTYREPVLKAKAHVHPEIRKLLFRERLDHHEMDKKIAFLMQFPIYDLEASIKTQDALFSPLAEWLLQDILAERKSREAMAFRFKQGFGRAEYCQRRPGNSTSEPCPLTPRDCGDSNGGGSNSRISHSDAHHICWELMKIFWVVGHFRPATWQTREVISRHTSRKDRDTRAPFRPSPSSSSVNVVLFGMWRAEELMLPTSITGNRHRLAAYPAVAETEDEGTAALDMLEYAFAYSGRPNCFDEGRVERQFVAPLELKFFEYFLQRHLDACFCPITFQDIGADLMATEYRLFLDSITIFSEDDVKDSSGFYPWGMLSDADFLDGSELLTKYPADCPRYFAADP